MSRNPLGPRQALYATSRAAGLSPREAAVHAGYAPRGASRAARRAEAVPRVRTVIAAAARELLEEHLDELEAVTRHLDELADPAGAEAAAAAWNDLPGREAPPLDIRAWTEGWGAYRDAVLREVTRLRALIRAMSEPAPELAEGDE